MCTTHRISSLSVYLLPVIDLADLAASVVDWCGSVVDWCGCVVDYSQITSRIEGCLIAEFLLGCLSDRYGSKLYHLACQMTEDRPQKTEYRRHSKILRYLLLLSILH